jgi:hypothetical protein
MIILGITSIRSSGNGHIIYYTKRVRIQAEFKRRQVRKLSKEEDNNWNSVSLSQAEV